MQTLLLSVPLQVITSMRLQQDPDKLLLIASTRLPQRAGCPAQLQVLIPKMDGYFTGTGKSECHSKPIPAEQHTQACYASLCHKCGGPWLANLHAGGSLLADLCVQSPCLTNRLNLGLLPCR